MPDGGNLFQIICRSRLSHRSDQYANPAQFGDGQAEAVRELFAAAGWTGLAVENDLTNRPRFLIAGRGGE